MKRGWLFAVCYIELGGRACYPVGALSVVTALARSGSVIVFFSVWSGGSCFPFDILAVRCQPRPLSRIHEEWRPHGQGFG
jgi:hypothetical protein